MPEQVEERPRPTRVFFFANGLGAVFDQFGHQMPEFQKGEAQDVIAAITNAGHRMGDLEEIMGVPVWKPAWKREVPR